MRAKITNFRGLRAAEIDLSAVALVCSPNAGGKSSTAQAIAAALTGQAVPLPGIKKTEAGMLVHSGTGKGTVEIEGEGGTISIAYPSAKIKTEGKAPPSASVFACGLASVADMEPKHASAALIEYLKATPAREHLAEAMAAADLDIGEAVKTVWDKIGELGWDGAANHFRDRGIRFKGQWEAIAGERYGSAKAERWFPAGWASDLDGASEESLTAAVTQAQEFLEAAIASTAVVAADRERLEADAAKLGARTEALALAEADMKAAQSALEQCAEALAKTPPAGAAELTADCPHCGVAVAIQGNKLVKPSPVDPAGQAARNQRRAAAESAHALARQKVDASRIALSDAQAAVRASEKAAAQLSARQAEEPGQSAGDVEGARENVREAEARLRAFTDRRKAADLHASVERNAKVQAILAPDGLRLRRLRDAIKGANVQLAQAAETAGTWKATEIGEDLTISYGGTPWPLLSESERWRARASLQTIMAGIDGSAALIFDAADILDAPGRNGLLRMAGQAGRPVLILMTMAAREVVPDLAAAGLGRSYWIEGGTVQPV